MTRHLLFISLTTTLVLATVSMAHASDHPRIDRCRNEGTVHTIRCLARGFDAPGTPDYAVSVARCESTLHPRAVSASGTFRGLFQQHAGYWLTRWRHFARPLGLRRSIFDPITNTVVSLRMARSAGSWRDWACA